MTTQLEDDDPRVGLGRGWVRVPGTCLYVGPLVVLLLLTLLVGSWVSTHLVYVTAVLMQDVPLRAASLRDGLAGAVVFLALSTVHEGTHALTVRALGGRVLRLGLGGGGAHVVYTGLEHRPRAQALVALAGPVVHLVTAAAVALLAAGSDWSRTAHAAVLAAAMLSLVEAAGNLLPWKRGRSRTDGWRALGYIREWRRSRSKPAA